MTIYVDFEQNAAFEAYWQSFLKDWDGLAPPLPDKKRIDYFWILSAAFGAGWKAAGGKENPQPVTVTGG